MNVAIRANFEDFLIARGVLTLADLDKADRLRKETGSTLCAALRRMSVVPAGTLLQSMSDFYNVPIATEDA